MRAASVNGCSTCSSFGTSATVVPAASAAPATGWPAALALGIVHRRSRKALVAAAVVPALLEWRAQRPALDPARYAAIRLIDDVAYGSGVLAGCWHRRSIGALRPALTGPFRASDN